MPVLPAITDGREALDSLVRAVAERGASYVNACALRLRSSARARYLPFIEKEFPHLAKRYWATYAFDHKVSASYAEGLRRRVRALCEKYGVAYGSYDREPKGQQEIVEARLAGEGADQLEFRFDSSLDAAVAG
jgi:DNA repair photolyase